MKTILLITGSFFLLLCLMGAGCKKDKVKEEIPPSHSPLEGKWILVGFGNDSTNEFITEPKDEPVSSYLIFENDIIKAFSFRNDNYQYYKVEGEMIEVTPYLGPSKVGSDTEWGLEFLLAIEKIYKFSITNDELLLYYEGQKFMKLKKDPDYVLGSSDQ